MGFSDTYVRLKEQWKTNVGNINSNTGTSVKWMKFDSSGNYSSEDSYHLSNLRKNIPGARADEEILENRLFEYPVFVPRDKEKNKGAILLLHGLNERKWEKYLPWADYLVTKTGKSVILFPISFHLNRSLPEWTDRQIMMKKAIARKSKYPTEDPEPTFINEALSDRLTELPERFFLSGLQTSNDIVSLLKDIYEGKHPLFEWGTHTDIFAYSIGGLLAQVLYIANPEELFSNSRLFLFCAGSLFHEMNGISKLIMDPVAYRKIHNYYTHNLEEEVINNSFYSDFFNSSKIGLAFRSMIAPNRLRNIREDVFREMKSRIYAISLKNDRVIPASAISSALLGTASRPPDNMEVLDFSFPYYHEMPFPVKQESLKHEVDQAFDKIFSKAVEFLGYQ